MAAPKLSVLIVGGGIAGLAAGAALRPFANVKILETAKELKDIGAAVTLGAGVVRILRSWGIHLEEWDGAVVRSLKLYDNAGRSLATIPFESREVVGEDVFIIHRADLHAALLEAATSEFGPGDPCDVVLGSKAVALDPEAGTVTLEDGTNHSADVVIAADGIRSSMRPYILGSSSTPVQTGETAYRMLISALDLKAIDHPLVDENGLLPPDVTVVRGPARKVVAYPCRGGHYLNLVCFIPDVQMNEETSDRWTAQGSAAALVEAYSGFSPLWTDIMGLGKNVGLWQLRDLDPLPTWVRGRAIIVGDAAHPMLPHQAGGALSAIEDAEALGQFLSGTTRDTVHEDLLHVFRVRFKRTAQFQLRSRTDGLYKAAPPVPHAEQMRRWDYIGAARWESEHADMVLQDGEEAVYTLEP